MYIHMYILSMIFFLGREYTAYMEFSDEFWNSSKPNYLLRYEGDRA